MESFRRCPLIFVISTVAAFGVCPSTIAQESRAAQIAEQQAAKAMQLAPEGSPVVEDVVKRVMSSPLLAGTGGVYPWFGSVYNGTGMGFGVGYLRRGAYRSRLQLTGAASTNGSIMGDVAWRIRLLTPAGRTQPFVNARVSRLLELPFYGRGPDTTPSDRTLVDYRPRFGEAGVSIALAQGFSAIGSVASLGFSSESEDPRAGQLPALGGSLDYIIGRVGATADWRPAPAYSTRGGFVRGDWQRYAARGGAPFSFDLLEFEAAQLIPLAREYFGLAFRALATTTHMQTGNEVPFVLLPSIGGGDTVRGIANRRFQDRSRVVLNAEYRWRPSRYLDMALFVDSGSVAPRLADIETRKFKAGYGVGARFHGPAFTVMRMEAAYGREGWRFIFGGGQPF